MSKRVLVIGINCFPELTGIGLFPGEMVNWLAENGHETTVVTSFPYYPYWKVQEPYNGSFYKKENVRENLTLYRCPMYIPANPNGLKRLLHEASFFLSSFFVIFRLLFKKKHDVIFSIAPPFHLGFLALFYRFFKGGKIVYHIQDLQVDAAKELKMLPAPLFSVLFALEKFILNRVNIVSTISDGMKKKVVAKTTNEVILFPNWADTTNYHPIIERDQLKPKWGFLPEDKLVLYSGSIGEKQGLDSLIRIANELKEHKQVKFIICGTGPFKEKLIEMAKDLQLINVFFLPLQGNDVFNDFLNIADVHLVLQKADASDLVMPSKLTTILSVGGLALITANPGTTLYEVVNEHAMGIVSAPENEVVLKDAIEVACTNDLSDQRKNARSYAERYLNKDNILLKITQDVFN